MIVGFIFIFLVVLQQLVANDKAGPGDGRSGHKNMQEYLTEALTKP